MRGISCVAKPGLASEEGIYSMESHPVAISI